MYIFVRLYFLIYIKLDYINVNYHSNTGYYNVMKKVSDILNLTI